MSLTSISSALTLTGAEAQGDPGEDPGDDPGYFFVIAERTGELHFGADNSRDGDLNLWNDLSWNDLLPGGGPGDFIRLEAGSPTLTLVDPTGNPALQEKLEQYDEDRHLRWSRDANAAEVAYMLFQAPVLVAVHAAEMLPRV